jgi:hypothetical protein
MRDKIETVCAYKKLPPHYNFAELANNIDQLANDLKLAWHRRIDYLELCRVSGFWGLEGSHPRGNCRLGPTTLAG